MTAYLIVRAEVTGADRDTFDRWYETEHLPDAHAAFGSLSARRGWSEMATGTTAGSAVAVHVAIYEFPSLDHARRIAGGSPEITALIAEFDRVWQDRVKRTREVVGVTQAL